MKSTTTTPKFTSNKGFPAIVGASGLQSPAWDCKNSRTSHRREHHGILLNSAPHASCSKAEQRAKKYQLDEQLVFEGWWSWGDLNPRPQALFGQIYMFSGLI